MLDHVRLNPLNQQSGLASFVFLCQYLLSFLLKNEL
jgi:hypothetical protein